MNFSPGLAVASGGAVATVLTAAGGCSKLQRLWMVTRDIRGLGMRCIPGSITALESLTSLDLQHCGLQGPQQLPANPAILRLEDDTANELPASLSSMTALVNLNSDSLVALPPAWPPRMQTLRVRLLSKACSRLCFLP